MIKIIRALILCGLTISLIACGDTKEEKKQDQAKNAIAEHSALRTALNNTSPITINSSDEAINEYEAKVNRLEALENQLRSLNGSNGIIISGGNNTAYIQAARVHIALVRATKISSAATKTAQEAKAAANNTAASAARLSAMLKLKALYDIERDLAKELVGLGDTKKMDRVEFEETLTVLNELEQTDEEIIDLLTSSAEILDENGEKLAAAKQRQFNVRMLKLKIAEEIYRLEQSSQPEKI